MASWCKTCGTDCTGQLCDDCRREQMRDTRPFHAYGMATDDNLPATWSSNTDNQPEVLDDCG